MEQKCQNCKHNINGMCLIPLWNEGNKVWRKVDDDTYCYMFEEKKEETK